MRCVDVGEVARACTCRVMGGERRVWDLCLNPCVARGDYRHRHICELRDMWECLATTRGFVSVRVISEEYHMGSMNHPTSQGWAALYRGCPLCLACCL